MADTDDRSNVLCFVTDQLRYDHLGCMGNGTIETPNIDALAADGVTCERAYVTNPVCMPSRASILTGRMPRETGVRFNGGPLDEDVTTLPEALSEAGYRTYSAGKLHLHHYSAPSNADIDDLDPGRHPECRALWDTGRIETPPEPYYGFDTVDLTLGHTNYISGGYLHWLESEHPEELDRIEAEGADPTDRFTDVPREDAHYNRWIADRTRSFIREQGDEPFFAWCSFPDPHPPWIAPEPWDEMYDPDAVDDPARREGELADLPPPFSHPELEDVDDGVAAVRYGSAVPDSRMRESVATNYGMTSFVDQEIGRVMETLDAEGLREDTIVVFLSDHGNSFGDHWQGAKDVWSHFDSLARVPFIWSWPDRLPEGRRVEGVVSTLDLVPTLLESCGVPTPEPGYDGYAEPGCGVPALPGTSLGPLLRGETESVHDGVVIEGDSYDGPRPRSYVTDRYKLTLFPGQPYGQLYDLVADPDELYNRWDDPEYADVKARLRGELVDAYVRSESGLPRKPGPGA
jgi:arylsulfatase A-like enzyme